MKKRILTVALAGMLAISLVACSKTDSTDKNAVDVTDYSKYVTLGDYTDLNIEVAYATVTDEQLQEKIDSIIEEKTTKEEITEGKVADGDSIKLDYAGTLDGEAVDDASATDYDYTIGGGFIDDLNDQLIGLTVGKEYELNCTFPEDYSSNTDLAGKEVVFTVTVTCIYGDEIVPTWDDDFINTYTSGEYTTTADYETYLKEELKTTNEATQLKNYESGIWSQILKNSTIKDYPEEKLDESYNDYYEYYQNYYEYMASYYGYEYEDLLSLYGLDDDSLKEQCMAQAKSEIGYIMLATVIASKEGITVSEDEYQSMAESAMENYTYESVEQFESDYGEDYIMESFLFKKVSTWLDDNNKKVEVDETTAAETESSTTDETTTATDETTTEAE